MQTSKKKTSTQLVIDYINSNLIGKNFTSTEVAQALEGSGYEMITLRRIVPELAALKYLRLVRKHRTKDSVTYVYTAPVEITLQLQSKGTAARPLQNGEALSEALGYGQPRKIATGKRISERHPSGTGIRHSPVSFCASSLEYI